MNYWLISDTHFNHKKLEEWGGRSGDWQEKMFAGLEHIPTEDVIIHLGDICIGNDEKVHEMIRNSVTKSSGAHPRLILVRGNHDNKGLIWYQNHGWDFVCDGIDLLFQGHYLHLTHRPARPQGNTTWNIHGHTHGNMHRAEGYKDFYSPQYHIDISPEIVGYKPIRLDTLMKSKKP